MSCSRQLIFVVLVSALPVLVQAQGRSGRERPNPRPSETPVRATQRAEVRINQTAQQQVQRRADENAQRSIERRAAAAELAARAAARRSAREANGNPQLRRFADSRGLRPELVAEQAMAHADVHAKIAAGLVSGKPLELTEAQRAQVEQVFGDADLLEPRKEKRNGRPERSARASSEDRQDGDEVGSAAIRPLPGSQANPNARLANAIRVRRAQISDLRDRALETGDEKLLERADRLEKTLDIFLANQARVEANLAEVGIRTRGDLGVVDGTNDSNLSDAEVRTAELPGIDSGLIEAPSLE